MTQGSAVQQGTFAWASSVPTSLYLSLTDEPVVATTQSAGAAGPDTITVTGTLSNGTTQVLASDGIVGSAGGWVEGTTGPGVAAGYGLQSLSETAMAVSPSISPLFDIGVTYTQTPPAGGQVAQSFCNLYATDGTAAGTQLLMHISATGTVSKAGLQTGDTASAATSFFQLGSAGNVTLMEGFSQSSSTSAAGSPSFTSSSVYFITNGTVAGTHLLTANPSLFRSLGAFNDVVYFSLTAGSQTYLLTEQSATGAIVHLAAVSAAETFTSVGTAQGRELFCAAGSGGDQLYLTDGTASGTSLVASEPAGDTFTVQPGTNLETTVTASTAGGKQVQSWWIDASGRVGPAGGVYSWSGGASGTWSSAANWEETTPGAGPVPGAADLVNLGAVGGSVEQISGQGTATYLDTTGQVDLDGTFAAKAAYLTGDLTIEAGASLTVAGTATVADGGAFGPGLVVSGAGARLQAGTLVIGTQGQLTASQGGRIQAAGLAWPGDISELVVDATSSIEIGTLGTAAPGSLAIDAGEVVDVGNTKVGIGLAAPTLALNGTIAVAATDFNRTFDIAANALSGKGEIRLAAQANLSIESESGTDISGGSGVTIDFAGSNSFLLLGADSLDASGDFGPAIEGFGGSNVLEWNGTLTSAAYAGGTLSLLDGSATVARLHLTGTYTGDTFQVVADPGLGGTQVDVLTGGDTAQAPAGTPTDDSYSWSGGAAGSWDAASNWTDSSVGSGAATVAPGAHDVVSIGTVAGSGAVQVVTGHGNAAVLNVAGAAFLDGQFTAGTANLNDGAGTIDIEAGDSLTVSGTATVSDSDFYGLAITGGQFVAGTLLYGANTYAAGDIAVSDHGKMRVGSLQWNVDASVISVDATSSFEVGTLGTAAPGSFTLDKGQTITVATGRTANGRQLYAPTVALNGTIAVGATPADANFYIATASLGGGTGQIQLCGDANLQLDNAAGTTGVSAGTGISIVFEASNNNLTLDAASLDSAKLFEPTLVGFNSSDVIDWTGGTVTAASYASGTLTLLDGTALVAKLRLAGNYAGQSFVALSEPGADNTQISLVGTGDTAKPPPGTAKPANYVWAGPIAGSWDAAASWDVSSTGSASETAAGVAPGAADNVTFVSLDSSGIQLVTGTGNAALLTVQDNLVLAGQFSAASSTGYGSITLDAGDTLSVTGTATVSDAGQIIVDGAGSRFIAGLLQITGTLGGVTVSDGGRVRVSAMNWSAPNGYSAIDLDAKSSMEIGTAGTAAAGSLIIDSGSALTITSARNGDSVAAPTLDLNGTLTVGSAAPAELDLSVNTLSGDGVVQLGAGSELMLESLSAPSITIGSGPTIHFLASTGTLSLGSDALNAAKVFAPAITGFAAGDTLDWQGAVTSATFAAGTLTLHDQATVVASLHLSGVASGASFDVVAGDDGASQITLVTAPAGTSLLVGHASFSGLVLHASQTSLH